MFSDTVEIRWFRKGEIPETVKTWYFSGRQPAEQSARTDYYHRQIAGGRMGIKLREGMIELKQFQQHAGKFVCGNGKLRGTLEKWRKWSFMLSEQQGLIPAIMRSGDWIIIEKKRWLRRYTLSGNEIFAGVEEVRDGCSMEVSLIRHNNITWWSLCLETFGQVTPVVVRRLGKAMVPIEVPFELPESDSISYPGWLKKFSHK